MTRQRRVTQKPRRWRVTQKGNKMDKQDLERRLIPYTEQTVRFDNIDLERGGVHGLQNREESEIPEETMEDYVAGWQRDDPFPPVILWQELPTVKKTARTTKTSAKTGPFFPIDGYTRCASAIRAEREDIQALIAECDEATARQLCIEANARHGRRASRGFLIEGAVAMTEQGMSIKEAAARAAVPEHAVSERRLIAKAISRARANHVSGVESLPDQVLEKVATIDFDQTFVALLDLARDAKLKPTKMRELIASVRKARSEADQLAIIEAERSELGVSKADDQAAKVAQPFTRFAGQLSKLRSFDLSEVVKAAYASNTAVAEVHDQVNRLQEVATQLNDTIEDIYGADA